MNIIAWCTCALVGLLLCGNVQAAERKGIAAVGLSRLSGASAGNLAAAVKDSGCRQFEFTFMPFFNPGIRSTTSIPCSPSPTSARSKRSASPGATRRR